MFVVHHEENWTEIHYNYDIASLEVRNVQIKTNREKQKTIIQIIPHKKEKFTKIRMIKRYYNFDEFRMI